MNFTILIKILMVYLLGISFNCQADEKSMEKIMSQNEEISAINAQIDIRNKFKEIFVQRQPGEKPDMLYLPCKPVEPQEINTQDSRFNCRYAY
jgi:hypothetical protein